MPGAQDILKQTKSQELGNSTSTPSPEPNATLRSKEAAEIAESELKRVAAEHKRKLLEKGYQTLEEALTDVEKKKQEANRILELAEKQETEIVKKLEEIEAEKQKLSNLAQVINQKEVMVKSRLEKAIEMEQEYQAKKNSQTVLNDELKKLIEYHKSHIRPCRQTLLDVTTAIYAWSDELTHAKVDFFDLYNYVCESFNIVDRYIEKTNNKKEVPHSETRQT